MSDKQESQQEVTYGREQGKKALECKKVKGRMVSVCE
jgi:hypothetical protein